MIVLIAVAAILAAGVLYELVGGALDTRRFPPPGRMIEAGSLRLHLNEQGEGAPLVLLEAGIAASSLSWTLVQPRIAEFTRVVSYDRAGLGWSDRCRIPRTVPQMVFELSAVLHKANLFPPYVLAGHSFGGLLIRAYAHLKPGEVSGLVFVDPVSFEFWANCDSRERRRLQHGVRLSRRGAFLAKLGIVRAALAALVSGARLFPKLIARASAGQGSKLLERLVGEVQKLPPAVWPMIRAHWSRPKCFEGMAAYLDCLPASAQAILQMPVPSGVPFIVLSASTATEAELAERDAWVQQSEKARHVRVDNCGHWLPLERPDAVVAAVRELVELARSNSD